MHGQQNIKKKILMIYFKLEMRRLSLQDTFFYVKKLYL